MLLPILSFGPMLMAIISFIVGRYSKKTRNILVISTTVAAFVGCLFLWPINTTFTIKDFCGVGLSMGVDGFRSLYALIASFMWMMTALFSPEYFAHYHNRNRYYFFYLMTLGATLGVFLSDDLFTTLIFFEIMSLTSYTWVAHEENPRAMKAAGTYLTVAVIGGMTTLMGLFMLYNELGTLSFAGLSAVLKEGNPSTTIVVAAWLTLFGFAAKAGLFPLHIWLPQAHPVAPAPASALLSGILTKSGVFGLLVVTTRIIPANKGFANALLVFAVITMFTGALLALFSVDLKRTLACSSMSQIGFITVGISFMMLLDEEGSLAAYGSILHMVNHSLIKLCLFMCAGVVYMNLHKLNLNDIKGFGRNKPVLHIAFLLGALSIGCIPPIGSGYNSKSLIHEGILEYIELLKESGQGYGIYKFIEILFLISGGLTIAYMTKLYICLFFDKAKETTTHGNRKYINVLSSAAILTSAVILPALGLLGKALMTPLAERSMSFLNLEILEHEIHYFSTENLIGAAESIAIGLLIYILIVRPLMTRKTEEGLVYLDLWPSWLDFEKIVYTNKFVMTAVPTVITALVRFIGELPETIVYTLKKTVFKKLSHKKAIPVGNRFTYGFGLFLNSIASGINKASRGRTHLRTDNEFVLAAVSKELINGTNLIGRSVSFGLLLLCAGLYATCIYLLFFR
ncbi:MAG: sodium:proton antiporter [Lachnospiraceae bacterium]|nr:sodium:proton antiporter [Lachnospiraceae bacterium]